MLSLQPRVDAAPARAGNTAQADTMANRVIKNSVFAQDTPGFLPGLPGSLLFFRCHGGFLFFFPVTFAFFRHNGSPGN